MKVRDQILELRISDPYMADLIQVNIDKFPEIEEWDSLLYNSFSMVLRNLPYDFTHEDIMYPTQFVRPKSSPLSSTISHEGLIYLKERGYGKIRGYTFLIDGLIISPNETCYTF